MRRFTLRDFVKESNRIEGINRTPLVTEMEAHEQLLSRTALEMADLMGFVDEVAPGHVLRLAAGMDVRVGSFYPIRGGTRVLYELENIVYRANQADRDPFAIHHAYETLRPFTDGNGRSGRALWLWTMGGMEAVPLGFLHTWYYQSLRAPR